jgi:hypothetical protein
MDLKGDCLGVCGLDSNGSGQGPVAGCCECGDEHSGSSATELVSQSVRSSKYPLLFSLFNYSVRMSRLLMHATHLSHLMNLSLLLLLLIYVF